jgi:hypothetical protein
LKPLETIVRLELISNERKHMSANATRSKAGRAHGLSQDGGRDEYDFDDKFIVHEEEDLEEGDDDAGEDVKKKKKKKRRRELVLEEEDYELLEENTVSGRVQQ